MNWIDILIAIYVSLGTARGFKRGIAEELYRITRTGLAFLGSLGLFAAVRSLLVSLLGLEGGVAGATGWFASFAGIFYLLRFIRSSIREFLEEKFGDRAAWRGGLLGGIRTLLNSVGVLVGASLAEVKMVIEDSFIGEIVYSLVNLGG